MEPLSPNTEVRLTVSQCFRTLTTSTNIKDITDALQTLLCYLDETPGSTTPSVQRAEFRRAHYTRTLQLLINNIQADWLHSLTADQRTGLWDSLFLHGPPEQALLVLMEGIGQLRWAVLKEECRAFVCFRPFVDYCCRLPSAGPAQIWTTWSASLRNSFRVGDSLSCCGYTVRPLPQTPPSSERLCWGA